MINIWRKPRQQDLKDLGPLYHHYAFFGIDNDQRPGAFPLNQRAKAPIITAYIAFAIAKAQRSTSDPVSFTELFCADGYYAMVAARLGCNPSIGIDNDRDKHFANARVIADRIGVRDVVFQKAEITPEATFTPTDIVANVGGLYHIDQPEEILQVSYRLAKQFLIIQSVVSLATEDEEYYEAPAPGWTWGNRYSRKSFDRMVRKNCPHIIDHHFNVLEGNQRMEDRGSVYYLIQK